MYGDASYGVTGYGTVTGVVGSGPNGVVAVGTAATAAAVYATSTASKSTGVYGKGTQFGVWGIATGNLAEVGVYGQSNKGIGVSGSGAPAGVAGSGSGYGVYGHSTTSGTYGIYGDGDATTGGVYGQGNSGVVGVAVGGGSYAGSFNGNVFVSGTVSQSIAVTRIDHPLDPANRYLAHAAVTSPEMLNLYSGSVVLDARGAATVRLPAYFHALNAEPRIQLTAVGAPAPSLHVASEVRDFRFRIAGGSSGQKVFWQVTGVRQDRWATANRTRVDYRKPPAERGRYLHPELLGRPRAEGLAPQPHPGAAAMRRFPACSNHDEAGSCHRPASAALIRSP